MRTGYILLIGGTLTLASLALVPDAPAATPPPADPTTLKVKSTYLQFVQARVKTTLDALQSNADFPAAEKALSQLFDQTTLYTLDDRPDALREADFALRLVRQLQRAPQNHRIDLLKFLRGSPNFAGAFVFLLRPGENPAGSYALLERLREKRSEQIETYATLAAAICVVHQRPLERRVNENTGKAIDPIDIFDYYVKYESRMFFGIRNVPAELLVYVVDATGSIDDMTWALSKYAGDKEIGKRFFDIKYDYEYFKTGSGKKLDAHAFTLPNILEYGGVCADQAYFAVQIGKAIGVPTAYTSGASGDVSHAWAGFLQTDGRNGWWNFDSGRYEAYRGVRGNVMDPQTRKGIPDSYVSLLGNLIGTKPLDRQNAVALTDAASRLIELEKAGADIAAPPADDVQSTSIRKTARVADTGAELSLLELALHQSTGYAPAWFGVRDLAIAKKLSLADKRRWADLLLRLGAKRYPDFTLVILSPMIATIPDSNEQDRLWGTVFTLFQNRFDLAASIRMQEAAMWEAQNDADKAGLCYMDVIERYANAGPFVIDALKGAEKVLVSSKRSDKVVALYEQTWARIKLPKQMAGQFMRQSNWYRVGKLYAKKLEEAGDAAKAASVTAQLDKPVTAAAAAAGQ
jgi:transglutaminase-like putative cysteine protease